MIYTNHALQEMENDDLGKPHVLAVLIHGEPTPTRDGRTKYQLHDTVVITAPAVDVDDIVVVTAWRDRGYAGNA